MPTSNPSRSKAISVGDHIRLPASAFNEVLRYGPQRGPGRRASEGVQGIVFSIREIATGKLVGLAAGDLRRYVFAIVDDQCFDRAFASESNCEGSKGPDRVTDNSIWQHLANELRQRAERRELLDQGGGGTAEPLRAILDGWRIVKLRAAELENLTESAG